ncbi:MAG: carbohydrate ABC transporter permease [Firmicutes bacterium]|nr:carbohydrate ABC transporter permease [Bacillota bacterium]
MVKKTKVTTSSIAINAFFILFSLSFILPFLLIVSISLSSEDLVLKNGYSLIPKSMDFTAYKYIFANLKQMVDSYKITALTSALGTVLGVLVMSLMAYPLSRRDFLFRKQLTFYIFFTMLFSGGLIPTYILLTQHLKMGDSMWVYIFPSLVSAWYIIILRTFFQGLPTSLVESAKMDGASEIKVFYKIILPLSKPVIATIGLFVLLNRWNDWYTSLIYIRSKELYTLQFLLQRILRDAQFVKDMSREVPVGINITLINDSPVETMKFAMCIVAAGPMLLVFPFFQKYFTRGLTVGAVKG